MSIRKNYKESVSKPEIINVTKDGGLTVHQIDSSDFKAWQDAGYTKHVPEAKK